MCAVIVKGKSGRTQHTSYPALILLGPIKNVWGTSKYPFLVRTALSAESYKAIYAQMQLHKTKESDMEEMVIQPERIPTFQVSLLTWYDKFHRDFPWREQSRTSYEVLIAEIMLKRTTTKKVVSVYNRFLARFPNLKVLAEADLEDISSSISDLGLRTQRTKTLKELAQRLCRNGNCTVPDTKVALLELPCVGEYTANAVLCFAFGNRVSIIDSNVSRLVGRYFYGIESSVNPEQKKSWKTMSMMLPKERYREFNYALLDFASLICKPRGPKHDLCPLRESCCYWEKEVEDLLSIHQSPSA